MLPKTFDESIGSNSNPMNNNLQHKEQENKRITLKIYNKGLKLMDEDNEELVGEIANYFIPHAKEEVVKVF